MDNYRKEKDFLGTVLIPEGRYYGTSTQRAIENFKIQSEKLPKDFIQSFIKIKKSCAIVNKNVGDLTEDVANHIISACDSILKNLDSFYQNDFPLGVWQTSGSGTPINMNINEVIANVANEKINGKIGGKSPIHPNDHVNKGQSTNDTFPTAIYTTSAMLCYQRLVPSILSMINSLHNKEKEFKDIIKIGRTHMQDAVPLTLGQEFSGYKEQVLNALFRVIESSEGLFHLAQGGTAVGTGLNAHPDFANLFTDVINDVTDISSITSDILSQANTLLGNIGYDRKIDKKDQLFSSGRNKFALLSSGDSLVYFHGALTSFATSLMKIANDIRMLASGPRCGIGELILSENEPGSSIMPGKVNPTQSEILTMIAAQVMGNQTSMSVGASNGHFELNVFKPLIMYNLIQSIVLISDSVESFAKNCIDSIQANKEQIDKNLNNSLMLVTILNSHIGYDNAAKIARYALDNNITLKQATIDLKFLSAEEYDKIVRPELMV